MEIDVDRPAAEVWARVVLVRPRLRMVEGADPTAAYRVLARTEQNCLVTRSLNADVQFEPDVEVVAAAGVSRDVAEPAGAGSPS